MTVGHPQTGTGFVGRGTHLAEALDPGDPVFFISDLRPFAENKQTMRFRRFSLRGRANIRGEWSLVCAAANALTIYRAAMA